MSTPAQCSWSGVFPAATTQFGADLALDTTATSAVQAALVRDGVHGVVLLGTVGENNSLTAEEKRTVLKGAVETVGGRVPLIAGVSELTNAFPAESMALYEAIRADDLERARRIYRWFMPLLHLDSDPDLVQSIKLAEALMGRGSERVRPPRLPLAGERRADVARRVERARATRPM